MRLPLAAILAATLALAIPVGAAEAIEPAAQGQPFASVGTDPFWPRVEALLSARAYPVAAEALSAELPHLRGEARNRANYDLGLARHASGQATLSNPALEAIPPDSLWYPRARLLLAQVELAEGRFRDSLVTLQLILPQLPDGASQERATWQLANDFYRAGAYRQAVPLFRDLQDHGTPHHREEATYALGICFSRLGDYPRAIWSWLTALKDYPSSARIDEAHLGLANEYAFLGKPALAARQLFAIPSDRREGELTQRAEFLEAEGLADAGEYREAIAHYQRIPADSPWTLDAAYGTAWCLWQQGDLVAAQQAFEALLAHQDAGGRYRVPAQYALAGLQSQQGRDADAVETYTKALDGSADPWTERILYERAQALYRLGRYQACLTDAERLQTGFTPGAFVPEATWIAGEAHLALGEDQQAVAQYDRLAAYPDLPFLHDRGGDVALMLGLAYFRAHNYQKAIAELQESKNLAYREDAAFWLAEAHYQLGDLHEAENAYGNFLSRFPHSVKRGEAEYGLAWCLLRRGDDGQAAAPFLAAMRDLAPSAMRDDAGYQLALIRMNGHDWDDAMLALAPLAAGAQDPGVRAEARFQMGICYMRLDHLPEAASQFQQYLALGPEASRYLEAKSELALVLDREGQYADAAKVLQEDLDDPRLPTADRLGVRLRLAQALASAGNGQMATEMYQDLLAEPSLGDGQRSDVELELFHEALRAGNLIEARRVLAQAGGHADPPTWLGEATYELATAYERQGDHADSAAALAGIADPTPEQQLLRAKVLLEAGNATAALTVVAPWPAAASGSAQVAWLEALDLRARANLANGDLDGAEQAWQTLIGAASTTRQAATAQQALSKALVAGGRYPEAAKLWEGWANQASGSAAVNDWLQLGQLARGARDYSDAATAYRRAEIADRGGSQAARARYWLIYTLVAGGRYDDALHALLAFPRSPNASWHALAILKAGEAAEHLQRWHVALDDYQRLAAEAWVPAVERREARERAGWIRHNVPPALMGGAQPWRRIRRHREERP